MQNPVQTLESARRTIRTDGWSAGDLRKEDGSVCALGALLPSECDFGNEYEWLENFREAELGALITAIKLHDPRWYDDYRHGPDFDSEPTAIIYSYNDESGRTAEEVLAVYDLAIQLAAPPRVRAREEDLAVSGD